MSFGKNLHPGYLDPKKSEPGKSWVAHNPSKRGGSLTHEKPASPEKELVEHQSREI
jgi:hypothetical protein